MKKIYVDRRPLPLLFFIQYKNAFFLLASFILFISFITGKNIPEGLSLQAYQTMIIFFFAIFLWVTNIIPLAITSLMIMGLLSTFHVLDASKIYSFFGNTAVFFIIGSFIMAAGISSSGLNKRIAYYVLSKFGDQPYKLALSIFFLAAFMSHIMPEHAVAALLFPILMSICESLRLGPNSILGKYMFFSLAWGCIIGGVVTFLGGARNPLAIGIMFEATGESIGFSEWMIAVAPPVYIIMGIVAFYIKRKVRHFTKDMKPMENLIHGKPIGKMTFKEMKAMAIVLTTIYMWIFYSEPLGIANIALLSAALFFVLNIMDWEDAKKEINWGAILMYGGAIALGKSLAETGFLEFISQRYIAHFQFSTLSFIGIVFFISLFLTEGISNTAVIVILLPIVLQTAMGLGLTSKLAVYLVAIPAGLAFMFPMGSPPNAIAFSSGYIKLGETLKIGIVLNFLCLVVFGLAALIYWPLIGVY